MNWKGNTATTMDKSDKEKNRLISFMNMKDNACLLYKAARFLLLLTFWLGFHTSFAQSPETWTTTGTWTCPAGVTEVTVECWGAGGGGSAGGRDYGSGGGGGGAYSYKANIPVVPGTDYTVTVGGAGAGGNKTPGGAGGDTWFIDQATIVAPGGQGGSEVLGNPSPGPGAGGVGGVATLGDINYSGGAGSIGNAGAEISGGGGSSAGTGSNGNPGTIPNGGTAVAGGGAGGNGGNGGVGTVGNLPGGGGGAAAGNNVTGSDGAGGQIILTYTVVAADKCASSSEIAPLATQTLCQADASTLLTNTITFTGTAGSPTNSYQWYYNISNSNTVGGATQIAGATSQTYSPLTGAPEIGDRWYFSVGYNADNNCGQTNSDQSLASSAAQVTINPPQPATPGGITGATTAIPSTGSLVYSITAVPNATTYNWSVPAGWAIDGGAGTISITVTSGTEGQNGNIEVTAQNSCGTSTASTLLVSATVGPVCPTSTTVAPGGVQTLCQDVAAAQLTATVNTAGGSGTPTKLYQWYYNTTNSNTVGGATPVGGATAADYTPLTSSSELGSRWYFCVGYATDNTCGQANTDQALASNAVEVTVNFPTPATPGAITGTATASENTVGLNYSITAVPNADVNGYTWTVPTGWSITAGGTTNSITVTSGASGENGDITVTASNSCGTSATSTLAVTSVASDCPTSTSIAPAGVQTLCQDVAATQLSASITTSGGSGTPTLLYQWYYNTTNSNTVTGATALGGATSQTYTPLTTVTELGSRWYFCVGYATDNSCAQTNTTQSLASNAVEITVNTTPTVGAITGSATVVENTGGHVYSIVAIPGASYVWTVPDPGGPAGWFNLIGQGTNSITVDIDDSNGDVTVQVSNACGTGNTSTLTVTTVLAPDCPTSSAVTPNGIQTVCEGVGTSQLTNLITSSGGSGTYTALYQWYYNTSNSNTVVGAITVGAATTSNYTPLSTSAEVGDRWYFSVGYATDNACAQTNADQALASNAVQITINPKPGTPTAITGNANPSPSTAGLIYSTTSTNADATGYTWTVPTGWTITAGVTTNSITVTSGTDGQNGNIDVTSSNGCGTSSTTTLAVTSSAAANPPTITLGANPAVCQGTTTANLTYSATSDSPDKYSIDWNATAEGQGFVDVSITTNLPATPIVLTVPGGAIAGTYYGNLAVKNTTSGLSSSNYAITVSVNDIPATPVISGQATPGPSLSGYVYTIPAVAGASNYTWTWPAGWIYESGQGTTTLTVTSGALTENGDITATVTNNCGTSAVAGTLTVTVTTLVDHSTISCASCHTFHNASGSALTNAAANAGLCLSCHETGGMAENKAFIDSDKAIPGTSGNSHSWDVLAGNARYETNTPSDAEMALRLDAGKIVCSTCHDQHNSAAVDPYLRIDNANDAMCKDCHSTRDVGVSGGAAINSHPVDVVYDDTNPKFNNTQTLVTNGNKVECSSCHGVHDVAGGNLTTDGYLLKMTNNAALCTDCHVTMTHNSMDCKDCHKAHDVDNDNLYMISDTITTPSSGLKPVIFTAKTGAGSFADGAAPYDGVCEVCHTLAASSHHQNNAPGNHNNGSDCTGCHPHDGGFAPSGGSCTDCHNSVQAPSSRSGAPQIVGIGGQFDPGLTSRHTPADPTATDCANCHYSSSHPSNVMGLKDQGTGLAYSGDTDVYCVQCHDNTHPNGAAYDKSNFITTAHDYTTNTCQLCHDKHGSTNANLLLQAANYDVCNTCHTSGGDASAKSTDTWTSGTNSHAWNANATNGTYDAVPPTISPMDSRLEGSNIVCSTCHDPHDNSNTKFLVNNNTTDQMCKDCHSARDVQRFQDGGDKGSHPVGVAYTGTGSVKGTPTGSVVTVGGNVECSSCHMPHNAATSDGNLLRQTNNNTLCTDCHNYQPHFGGMTCLNCHDTHGTGTNIYLIKNSISTPNSGIKTVVFPDETEFADGDGTYDGVCEVCHTTTGHHQNDGGDATAHNDGANCTSCHAHNDATNSFPNSSCHGCHDATPGAYQWPTAADGLEEGSHAVHCSPPYEYSCNTYHQNYGSGGSSEASHSDGGSAEVNMIGGLGDDGATPAWNGTTCDNVYCHSDSRSGYTVTPAWTSGSINDCTTCHGVDVSSSVHPPTGAHDKHTDGILYDYACSTCHNGLINNTHTSHVDGTRDVVFDPGGLAKRDGTDTNTPEWEKTGSPVKTCDNVYCHSNGRTADRGSEGVADWGFGDSPVSSIYPTTPAWTTGTITACQACHEGPSTMPAAPNYTITEGSATGQVTSTAQFPPTGAHLSQGAHKSNDQLVILTEDGTYGDALTNSWPFVQCFWCHNNEAGAATGVAKKQGTYATSKHVDGNTWFYPSWYGYGGMGEKTSGGQAPAYYIMDTEAEITGLGNGYVWHPESANAERRGSMVPGLAYAWMGPTSEHCGNGKKCW